MKLLLLAPLAVLWLQAGVNTLQQQKPTGSIEGTITRAGSNQPVANARVTINRRNLTPAAPPGANAPVVVGPQRGAGPAPPPILPVMTDDKGKFSVGGLEDGAYAVYVQADGYVAQQYGQKGLNDPGFSLVLVNVSSGQATKDINVALVPAATISGRVHDPLDQPLINAPMQLLRYSYDYQGQRSYQTVGSTVTNDHGEYRMFWVTPGRYYLLAGKPSTGSNAVAELYDSDFGGGGANGNAVPAVLGYAFYPGVQEIANARTIEMQPGADLQFVDLTLVTKPRTFKVRGKIVDSRNGQPPSRATVSVAPQIPLSNQNADIYFGPDGPSQNYNAKTGIFEIADLLPGTYSIVAMVTDTPVPGARGPLNRSSAMMPVTIGSSDIDNLTISVVPAAAIPGRIRIDGQLPAQMSIERLRVQLTPIATSGTQPSLSGLLSNVFYQNSQVAVSADGSFRLINVVPGDYRIDFSGFPIGAGGANGPQYYGSMQNANAYIKDARFDGNDALNAPVRFSGSVNNGLEITLAFASGRVDGTVTDARSQPAAGGRIVAVPDRMRFRTDLYRPSTIDQNGRFGFQNLPPGDYKLYAWEAIEDNGWFDPDLLARGEGRAHSIHVSEGSTQSVSLQINPSETSR